MKQVKKTAPFVVISGPSGSGKTTICRRVADELGLYYSVSHTTRPQRENEVHGRDYFFSRKDDFLGMVQRGEFLEWAQVYDFYYGTSKKLVQDKLESGQGVIVDVDPQGAWQIKKLVPDAVQIFISVPDIKVLEGRLARRRRDSQVEIDKRLRNAGREMRNMSRYDHAVINADLDRAVLEVKKIIVEGGKSKHDND